MKTPSLYKVNDYQKTEARTGGKDAVEGKVLRLLAWRESDDIKILIES